MFSWTILVQMLIPWSSCNNNLQAYGMFIWLTWKWKLVKNITPLFIIIYDINIYMILIVIETLASLLIKVLTAKIIRHGVKYLGTYIQSPMSDPKSRTGGWSKMVRKSHPQETFYKGSQLKVQEWLTLVLLLHLSHVYRSFSWLLMTARPQLLQM